MSTIKVVLGVAAAFLVARLLLRRYLASRQLSHIPGPAITSWTRLWLFRKQLSGKLARDFAELHRIYGPIVRIGPSHVTISDPLELRKIWAVRSPWYRGQWYELFHFGQPVPNVLSLRNDVEHARLRAMLYPGYTGKDVDDLMPTVDRRILDFVDLIERKYISTESNYKPMDLTEKAQFLTMDVVSSLAFGQCFGCLEADRDTFRHLEATKAALPVLVALSAVPDYLSWMQSPLMRRFLPSKGVDAMLRMRDIAAANAAKRYGPDKIVARDMLGSFVAHGLPPQNAAIETFGQIGAGTDTTATAIRMTMMYLMTNHEAYYLLKNEIDDAIRERRITTSPISETEAKKLPYLQAVIREGLRIWPPVAGLMPKICDTEQVVCGMRLPPGVDVSWSAIAVLRDRIVFGEDAETFKPSRWLEQDQAKLKVMEQIAMMSFGTGSRWECLGKTIALLELNKVFVELLRRFDFTIVNAQEPLRTYDCSLSLQSDMWVRVVKREVSLV